MAKLALKKAATDVTVYLFAQDSSKTTGVGLAGLAYNTASLTAYYVRPLGSAAAITLATQTVTGAHSDGGFVEVDATNMPGVYRLDLPDAVCATGVPSVVVMLKGATNLAPVLLEIQLTDFDLNDASPNVTVNDMASDSLTAAALKADAVTEIVTGIWGADLSGYGTGEAGSDLLYYQHQTYLDLADGGRTDLLIDSIITHLTDIKGAGWTNQTLAKIVADIAAISAGSGATAQEVWSHPHRTLTVPAVAAAATEDGTTLTLYKDADINIEFTGLTIPTGAKKVVFTIKDNLDDADTASALQATYQLVAPSTETHTLNYINSAVPPVLTTPVTFTVDTDSVEFDMTAAAAYYLPRYERGYLHWDLKLITATTVQILQQGLVQILGTSTRAVA